MLKPGKRVRRWPLLLLPLVALAVIYCPGIAEWVGRLIVVACLFAALMVYAFGTSLNPWNQYVKGGKLARPGMEKQRRVAEMVFRVFVFGFGVFFTLKAAIPFAADCREVIGIGQPLTVTGVAARNRAVPLIEQSVNLLRNGTIELHSWTMFVWIHPLRHGLQYRLTVLPRSRIILMTEQLSSQDQ